MNVLKIFSTAAGTAQGAIKSGGSANPGAGDDLMGSIKQILNAVFSILGVVSVIMIIVGGISYATSQGDPSKVKKGKDTILYGIIGLVVALLAFAIVNFALSALSGGTTDIETPTTPGH